jgi:hypothetical protein
MVQFRTVSNVGATGFEQPPILPDETWYFAAGGAESGAICCRSAIGSGSPPVADPLLAMVVEAWPSLPADQRLAVVEIIAAAGGRPGAAARRRQ